MKIVVDKLIPFIEQPIQKITNQVVFVSGDEFTPKLIKDADALIIRTRTHCNANSLKGSNVKFIATATIGFDHIDTDYCKQAGITWCNAPGCNANAVAQYVQSSLLVWAKTKRLRLKGLTMGIIGVGNVGHKVAKIAEGFGMRVLLNDPPRMEKEGYLGFTPLDILTQESDIVSFHVPLTMEGQYKTYHMANHTFLDSLKKKPLLINTSRGEVTDTTALLNALREHLISDVVLDVWENEPHINTTLAQLAFICTPHIAGYSMEGKANATAMALEQLCHFFKIKADYSINLPAPPKINIKSTNNEDILLTIYNPLMDSEKLKHHPDLFEQYRNNYPLRREAQAYNLSRLQ